MSYISAHKFNPKVRNILWNKSKPLGDLAVVFVAFVRVGAFAGGFTVVVVVATVVWPKVLQRLAHCLRYWLPSEEPAVVGGSGDGVKTGFNVLSR